MLRAINASIEKRFTTHSFTMAGTDQFPFYCLSEKVRIAQSYNHFNILRKKPRHWTSVNVPTPVVCFAIHNLHLIKVHIRLLKHKRVKPITTPYPGWKIVVSNHDGFDWIGFGLYEGMQRINHKHRNLLFKEEFMKLVDTYDFENEVFNLTKLSLASPIESEVNENEYNNTKEFKQFVATPTLNDLNFNSDSDSTSSLFDQHYSVSSQPLPSPSPPPPPSSPSFPDFCFGLQPLNEKLKNKVMQLIPLETRQEEDMEIDLKPSPPPQSSSSIPIPVFEVTYHPSPTHSGFFTDLDAMVKVRNNPNDEAAQQVDLFKSHQEENMELDVEEHLELLPPPIKKKRLV